MTDDLERIGGISVSMGVDDSSLDSDLESALARMKSFAQEAERALSINMGVQGGPQAAGTARRPPPQQQPPPLTFGTNARAYRGSETSTLRAINEQLALTGERMLPDGNIVPLQQQQQRSRQGRRIEAADVTIETPNVNVQSVQASDTAVTDLTASINALTEALRGLHTEAARPIAIATTEAQQATEAAVDDIEEMPARRGRRRRNIRDQSVGTEADTGRIYTYGYGAETEGMVEPGAFQQERAPQQPMAYSSGEPDPEALEQRRREVAQGRQIDLDRTRREQEDLRRGASQREVAEARASINAERATTAQGPSSTTFDILGPPQVTPSNQQQATPEEIARRRQIDAQLRADRDRERQGRERARFEAPVDEEIGQTQRELSRIRQIDVSEADIERRITGRRAAITGGGQTPRTLVSGLGALFGGSRGAQIEAQVRAQAAARELASSEKSVVPIERQFASLDARINSTTGRYKEWAVAQKSAFGRTEEVTTALARHEKAVKADAAAQEELRSFETPVALAKNLAAITVAGAAFSLGMKAVNFTVDAIVPALQQAADAAMGFGATSTRVTTSLAQQTAAAHGNVQVVLAQRAAQAGLSATTADYLDTQLRLTTQVKAGAIAQQQASELFRASVGLGQTPQGLIGGFGGLFGSALFGEQMGGGKGFAEILLGDFKNIGTQTGAIRPPITAFRGAQGPQPITAPTEEIDRYVQDLNDAGQRGAQFLRQQATKFVVTQDEGQLEAARQAGGVAADFAELGIVLTDVAGNVIATKDAFEQALSVFARGRSIPDFGTMLREQRPAIEAQVKAAATARQQALEVQLPAQQALRNLAQPMLPPGTGIAAEDQQRVAGIIAETQGLQDNLNAGFAKGAEILRTQYKIPQQLITDITNTGQAIAQTQADIANWQAEYTVAQYNFQLHIAKRSLTDIQQVTGQIGQTTGDNLGIYERQNLLLGRQAQQFQFGLTQRQINFQTALAGFQAPGVTPAERRARMEEAKIVASFSQKQLDIQRQMFGNQVKIVDIGNLRQATDLANQIGLMIQGRQVTIDTAAAEQKIARLSTLQEQQVAMVGTYVNEVDTLTSNAISSIANMEATVGRAIDRTQGKAVTAAYQVGLAFFQGAMGGLLPETNPPRRGAGGNFAGGIVGTTTGETTMTVGEAGAETVAVLRNPRTMTGGFGGGTNVVNFNGPMYVRDEADIDEIARKVEQAMGRKASLIGLRAPG